MTKNDDISWKWLAVTLSGATLAVAGMWATWVTSTLIRVDKTVERIEHHVDPSLVDRGRE